MSKLAITVRKALYAPAPDERTSDHRSQRYVDGTGLRRMEHRTLQRETGLVELYLSRLGQREANLWHADCYRYNIDLPA
jgi:hypothetical protein